MCMRRPWSNPECRKSFYFLRAQLIYAEISCETSEAKRLEAFDILLINNPEMPIFDRILEDNEIK